MKTYLVSFRDKKTLLTKKEVKVNYDEEAVKKTPKVLVLAALEELTRRGETLPNSSKTTWSWREF